MGHRFKYFSGGDRAPCCSGLNWPQYHCFIIFSGKVCTIPVNCQLSAEIDTNDK